MPDINEILNLLPEEYDVQQRLNRQVPEVGDLLQQRLNSLRGTSDPISQAWPDEASFFANNASDFHIPAQTSSFNPFWRINPTGGLKTTCLVLRLQLQSEAKKLKQTLRLPYMMLFMS